MSRRLIINGRFLQRAQGGVDRVALEMAKALASLFVNQESDAFGGVSIITPGSGEPCNQAQSPLDIQEQGWMRGQFWEQLQLPLIARNEWLFNPCNLAPIFKTKSVATIHDAQVFLVPEAYSRSFRAWYRLTLPIIGRRANIITTVSEYSKKMLEHYDVIPAGKASVIHNGADHIHRVVADETILGKFALLPFGYFLMIGNLSRHKNIQTVIRAMSHLKDMKIPLVVAGGASPKVFANAGLKSEPNVFFLGRVTDEELKGLYSNARCLLFPSLFEGFGLPPLEAMGCGCPVIASNSSAIPEVCGDAALYASPTEVDAWVSNMRTIASDEDLCSRLRVDGISHAARYTWRDAAHKLLDLISAYDSTQDFSNEYSSRERDQC